MSTPADVPEVPTAHVAEKPQKQRKPPSPHLPRLFAALAIITLLAVPVVVPVVVMKMTGTTGRKDRQLADAIEGPDVTTILVTAPEETTQEEIQESFLKLNDNKVSACNLAVCWPRHLRSATTIACIVNSPAAIAGQFGIVGVRALLFTSCAGLERACWTVSASLHCCTVVSPAHFAMLRLLPRSLSVSADLTTQLVSTHMSSLRQPWCPGVQKQLVSAPAQHAHHAHVTHMSTRQLLQVFLSSCFNSSRACKLHSWWCLVCCIACMC
jgi:hypothetical protein